MAIAAPEPQPPQEPDPFSAPPTQPQPSVTLSLTVSDHEPPHVTVSIRPPPVGTIDGERVSNEEIESRHVPLRFFSQSGQANRRKWAASHGCKFEYAPTTCASASVDPDLALLLSSRFGKDSHVWRCVNVPGIIDCLLFVFVVVVG